jgi:hypothetical protein
MLKPTKTRKRTANAAPWAPVGMLREDAHGAAFASQVLAGNRYSVTHLPC